MSIFSFQMAARKSGSDAYNNGEALFCFFVVFVVFECNDVCIREFDIESWPTDTCT